MIRYHPSANLLGREVASRVPAPAPDVFARYPWLSEIWDRAAGFLAVRSNDAHTLHSVALADSLLDLHPSARSEVVLAAMMLHDTGWSRIEPDRVLAAIAPGGGDRDLVLAHEREGAAIAEAILTEIGFARTVIDAVVEIIDGHDSRLESLHLDDSLVKDSDKLWRATSHGIDTIMDWFGLTRAQALTLVESRVLGHLFTKEADAMARGLIAVERTNLFAQRRALGG